MFIIDVSDKPMKNDLKTLMAFRLHFGLNIRKYGGNYKGGVPSLNGDQRGYSLVTAHAIRGFTY